MKTGRNDPCPCGSGKKYKKCCLNNTVVPAETLQYRRLSEAHDRLIERLMAFADKKLGSHALSMAFDEFMAWPEMDDEFDDEQIERFGPLFWPWYFFNWEYEADSADDPEHELDVPQETTIAEMYLDAHGDQLDSLELRVIEAINREPYSFWDVCSVETGRGMTLYDLLRGFRIDVQERMGSQFVQPGDVVFARVAGIDGVGMIVGLSPTVIPPERKPEIIKLRKLLQKRDPEITDDTLYEYDLEIRNFYFHLDRSLHSTPQMANTDGEPLEFHRMIFEVDSAQVAFDKLRDLCVTQSLEDLAAAAERDGSGRIVRAEIAWDRAGHKANAALPNTVLGRIIIDGKRMVAQVNSAERAVALRREIETRMGNAARFKIDEIQDMEAMMATMGDGGPGSAKSSKEQEELMQRPEVQEQLKQFITQHWKTWVDQPIPALGGLSPREAVKTEDGRQSVDALLQSAERGDGIDPLTVQANREGTQWVRKALGLKPHAK